jgi:serine/threonine-protein kinase
MSTGGPTSGPEPTRTAPGSDTSAATQDSDRTVHSPGAAAEQLTLKKIGRYEVLKLLGQGGMGWVYLAYDGLAGRNVALKMLPPGPHATGQNRRRFETEFRAAAQLDHPNIVPVYDVDSQEGQLYFTMKYLEGHSLAHNRERLRGDARVVVTIIAKVARAMHFAHEKRVLHRDLKPGNILLDANGEPMIGDFGLAKLLDAGDPITMSDALVGTLPYMSPEQRAGRARDISFASDIYALGVTLYEMITGERPNPDEDGLSITARDPELKPGQGSEPPTLDPVLAAIIGRCLRKAPRDRYPSAEALAVDLEKWLLGEPVTIDWPRAKETAPAPAHAGRPSRRAFLIAGAAAATVAAGSAGVIAYRHWRDAQKRDIGDQLAAELARGGKVELQAGDGRLRYANVLAGSIDTETASESGTQILSIASRDTGLLEIFPSPGVGAFRFSGEVRQDQLWDGVAGAVGLFVGRSHQIQVAGTQEFECFIPLSFQERTLRTVPAPKSEFNLEVFYLGPSKHHGDIGRLQLPAEAQKWRLLSVTLTKERVYADVDGIVITGFDRGQLSERDGAVRRQKNLSSIGRLQPNYKTSDGIGLIADRCRASFRNLRVERLLKEE